MKLQLNKKKILVLLILLVTLFLVFYFNNVESSPMPFGGGSFGGSGASGKW
ncbi:hypothetical protein [Hyunsoonleella flava]|uniref:hypothetical protein n=1 Tax=Hyunsoonleella flava TaxID=2527939 RepID=UPI0013EEEB11|nr:hypothetical protein [Hyunsoonleella flava]